MLKKKVLKKQIYAKVVRITWWASMYPSPQLPQLPSHGCCDFIHAEEQEIKKMDREEEWNSRGWVSCLEFPKVPRSLGAEVGWVSINCWDGTAPFISILNLAGQTLGKSWPVFRVSATRPSPRAGVACSLPRLRVQVTRSPERFWEPWRNTQSAMVTPLQPCAPMVGSCLFSSTGANSCLRLSLYDLLCCLSL